jgi:hypothetical protein
MTTTKTIQDPVGTDLTAVLRALKLSGLKDTLPERLALARQQKMGHAAFLELLLSDEITRRESRSATLRAAKAGLDPTMRVETFEDHRDLSYDRTLWSDLTSLRFTEAGNGVLILGPVGVGKTHLATTLGHTAIRRRLTVAFYRADKLSPDYAQHVSTTPSRPRSAASPASTSSSSTTSHSDPSMRPRPTTSTRSSSNATGGHQRSGSRTVSPPSGSR